MQAVTPYFKHTGTRETKVFVDTLPALGYRLYYAGEWEPTPARGTLKATESSLENDPLRAVHRPGDRGDQQPAGQTQRRDAGEPGGSDRAG